MNIRAYRKTKWFKKFFRFEGYRIEDINSYLVSQRLVFDETLADVDLKVFNFRQSSLQGGVNNCSLVSITRVVNHLTINTEAELPLIERYKDLLEYASHHGYTHKRGTPFFKIKQVFTYALEKGGLKLKPVTRLAFLGAKGAMKRSLDKGYPLLINLAFGYYDNHTVTAAGYKELACVNAKGKRVKKLFIRVVDGWSSGTSYLDWDAFAKSASLGIGTLTILK